MMNGMTERLSNRNWRELRRVAEYMIGVHRSHPVPYARTLWQPGPSAHGVKRRGTRKRGASHRNRIDGAEIYGQRESGAPGGAVPEKKLVMNSKIGKPITNNVPPPTQVKNITADILFARTDNQEYLHVSCSQPFQTAYPTITIITTYPTVGAMAVMISGMNQMRPMPAATKKSPMIAATIHPATMKGAAIIRRTAPLTA